jgi:putative Mg2+ transporter-C (MgtC) family protein
MEDITNLGELLPRFLIEIVVAIICGGLIGLERGLRHKAAGLRDYILICLGAVLFMKISELVALRIGLGQTGDPGRIAAQVVTGIGFIGAGAIIHRQNDVAGITTAASIWVVAAIGLTIGAGYPLLAMLVTGAVLLTLTLLSGVEKHLKSTPRSLLLRITVREDTTELREKLKTVLESGGVKLEGFRSEPGPTGTKLTIKAPEEPREIRELLANLWTLQGVSEIEH